MASEGPQALLAVGASILAALVTGCPTSRCSTGGLLMRELLMWVCALAHVAKVYKGILRNKPTFRDATTGFPAKWRLRKFHADDVHNQDLGSASDWLKQISSRPGSWDIICMEFLQSLLRRHFAGKPVLASRNAGCLLRLIKVISVKKGMPLNKNEACLLEKCT